MAQQIEVKYEKLRINLATSKDYLSKYESWLWAITRYYLDEYADFGTDTHSFTLNRNPFPKEKIHPGPYRIGKNIEDANIYRIGHPLAQRIIGKCKELSLPNQELIFHYTDTQKKISILEPLIGKSGWLEVTNIAISAFETEDYLILSGISDNGESLEEDSCRRLFSMSADSMTINATMNKEIEKTISDSFAKKKKEIFAQISSKNANYFEIELDKLDKWGEDKRNSLRLTLKELDDEIKEIKRQARLAPNLPEKLKLEKEKRQLESKRDEAWREYDRAAREIESKKDGLIDEIEKKLKQKTSEEKLFTIRWKIV